MRFCSIVLLAVIVSLQAAACSRDRLEGVNAHLRSGALRGSNLLLITVDTLRADRVGAYGGGHLTPTIDRLAAGGIRFSRAHSHVPLTLPAHASILTGLLPATHGLHRNGTAGLDSHIPTLAERLHGDGYRTGAFVGAFVLDARFGLNRGFDTYDDRVGSDTGPITFAFAERTADRVTQLAGDWILRRPNPQSAIRNPQSAIPWFAWVHLFDPHAPYRAPEQRAANPYDNEVAFADAQIGGLLQRLRGADQLDSTLVVVLADHGESLGEHGEATHGLLAYEATLRIPLVIAGPSIAAAVSDAAVAQDDVLPTVLDLLGIAPPPRIDGRSLVPAMRGEAESARPIYLEALDAYLTRNWAPLTGIVVDGWKYIDLPEPELYDLAHDPGELRNLVRDDPRRADALAKRLSEWPPPSAPASAAKASPIDPDAAARLRSLGYTAEQAPNAGRKRYTSADDPKHLMDLDRRYERALTATGEGHYTEAATLLQSVVAERPDFTVAYLNLASVFIAAGQPKRAAMLIEEAATHGVTSSELQGRRGAAYLASGEPARAATVLEPIAGAAGPGQFDAMNTLGIALQQLGRYDRARQLFAAVLAQWPRSATTWSNLGLLELSVRHTDDAVRAFAEAVAADPRLGQAWQGLAAARAPRDPTGAVDAWRHALELEPGNYDLLFNLAVTLRDQGQAAEARPYAERFVREAPAAQYGRDIAVLRAWLAR